MRTYGQYCPIARGSEILAERWTPIILRNVLLGCRTFNEIAAGAPGLSRALLTRRLRELEQAGVIEIRTKERGRGSLYVPTLQGRELWPVLQAIGDWSERWMNVTIEHADPDVVLWSWCYSFLRRDLLPPRRVQVRFEFPGRGATKRLWLLLNSGDGEVCNFDPGFGDDVLVTVDNTLTFARWHLGLVEWASAVKSGGISTVGPSDLCRALPTWNGYPDVRSRRRAEHRRAPGGPPPLPPGAVPKPSLTPRGSSTASIPGFAGRLIVPGDEDYDAARAVWNGAIDRKPRIIALCRDADDVAAALRYGREQGMTITVRGGGHGVAGAAVCDDGLVVDLSGMKAVRIDPAARTAAVQAGVLWGELDAATQAFGLATTGGIVSHTGVSGLTLGGGIGWLMRRHGLTVDNLIAAEMTTAAGQMVTASEHENPDLFWGLRGGGHGLGVVTSFTYRLHEVGPEILAGPVIWAAEDAEEVLHEYRDLATTAPPEVCTTVALRRAPAAPFLPVELHGREVCMITMVALGDQQAARSRLAPLRSIGHPLFDLVKFRPYAGLQSLFDTTVPHGWHYYWKSTGLTRLDKDVIATLANRAYQARSPRSYTIIFQMGGAVSDVDPEATAFTRRDVPFELNANAVWLPGQRLGDAESAWARSVVDDLAPYHAGVYRNFLDHDDHERLTAAHGHGANTRLLRLRREWDPDGVLIHNGGTA
ncbi:MAG: FAD-binding protein [Actinomycetota bacterium]